MMTRGALAARVAEAASIERLPPEVRVFLNVVDRKNALISACHNTTRTASPCWLMALRVQEEDVYHHLLVSEHSLHTAFGLSPSCNVDCSLPVPFGDEMPVKLFSMLFISLHSSLLLVAPHNRYCSTSSPAWIGRQTCAPFHSQARACTQLRPTV